MASKAERRADAATAGPVGEVARAIATSPALNVDETGCHQGRERAWPWTAVGPGMTLFRIDRSRGADALRRLDGEAIAPVVTSDRFPTYERAPRRQIRWAHLRRDFQAMIDRAAGGQGVGAKLLALSGRAFDWWRRLGSGAIRRSTLRGDVGWLRRVIRLNLEAGRDGPCKWTAKVCRQLLLVEGPLWTFARAEGSAPTTTLRSGRCAMGSSGEGRAAGPTRIAGAVSSGRS